MLKGICEVTFHSNANYLQGGNITKKGCFKKEKGTYWPADASHKVKWCCSSNQKWANLFKSLTHLWKYVSVCIWHTRLAYMESNILRSTLGISPCSLFPLGYSPRIIQEHHFFLHLIRPFSSIAHVKHTSFVWNVGLIQYLIYVSLDCCK